MKMRHIDTAVLLLVGLFAVPVLHAADKAKADRAGQNTAQNTAQNVTQNPAQNPGRFIDDATLTTKVKVTLLSDNLLSAFEVKVNTQSGIVTLSGEVDKPETIQRAIKLTSAIPGVKAINTHLMVKVASFTWDGRTG